MSELLWLILIAAVVVAALTVRDRRRRHRTREALSAWFKREDRA